MIVKNDTEVTLGDGFSELDAVYFVAGQIARESYGRRMKGGMQAFLRAGCIS